MSVNVFLGSLGSRVGSIFRDIGSDEQSIRRGVGHLAGIDAIGGVDALSFGMCKRQLEFHINNLYSNLNDSRQLFVTGLGCTLYAREFIKEYPNFNYYFFRNSKNRLGRGVVEKILDMADVSEEWILETDSKINHLFDEMTTELNLTWVPYIDSNFFKNATKDEMYQEVITSRYKND